MKLLHQIQGTQQEIQLAQVSAVTSINSLSGELLKVEQGIQTLGNAVMPSSGGGGGRGGDNAAVATAMATKMQQWQQKLQEQLDEWYREQKQVATQGTQRPQSQVDFQERIEEKVAQLLEHSKDVNRNIRELTNEFRTTVSSLHPNGVGTPSTAERFNAEHKRNKEVNDRFRELYERQDDILALLRLVRKDSEIAAESFGLFDFLRVTLFLATCAGVAWVFYSRRTGGNTTNSLYRMLPTKQN